ncbi:MAG: Rieske 2Fe-2S domain-containing protein [Planctomycetales bacterium]
MGSGLLAGYGFFAAIAARFLYPAEPDPEGWIFVAPIANFKQGDSLNTKTPAGQPMVITRLTDNGTAEDFIALSGICPHLGCMVHWEANHNRFFCPCHNGAFDPQGTATQGPPHLAHQSLSRFPLQIENGLLFVRVKLNNALG